MMPGGTVWANLRVLTVVDAENKAKATVRLEDSPNCATQG